MFSSKIALTSLGFNNLPPFTKAENEAVTSKGFIPDPVWKKKRFKSPNNIWYPGDTYNLSIGQGYIGITPLEEGNLDHLKVFPILPE